jgi:hypothetical protein
MQNTFALDSQNCSVRTKNKCWKMIKGIVKDGAPWTFRRFFWTFLRKVESDSHPGVY